jgi:hypothetical protein
VRLLTFIVLASVTALTGCLTSSTDTAQLEAADNEKCVGYGTTPGTPAYTDCRLKLERLRTLAAAEEASRPPPAFKNCPTSASGLACTGF